MDVCLLPVPWIVLVSLGVSIERNNFHAIMVFTLSSRDCSAALFLLVRSPGYHAYWRLGLMLCFFVSLRF